MSSGIEKDQVVTFHYILKDKDGTILDQSVDGSPLHYLHGHHNIVPGLESQMASKKVGDKLLVHVTPESGYGDYDPDKRFLLDRSQLPDDLEPGLALELHDEDGETLLAVIVAVEKQHVEVDANHPMAGKDLHFDVEILSIRPASAEEIQHGHVHGPGGHHH